MPRRPRDSGRGIPGGTVHDETGGEPHLRARMVRDLPTGRRENLLWRLSATAAFNLNQPLDQLLDTCAEQIDMTYGDRAVQDRSGVYHLFAGDRSICLGLGTRSEWCETQVRFGDASATVDVARVALEQRCARAAGRWPPPPTGRHARGVGALAAHRGTRDRMRHLSRSLGDEDRPRSLHRHGPRLPVHELQHGRRPVHAHFRVPIR